MEYIGLCFLLLLLFVLSMELRMRHLETKLYGRIENVENKVNKLEKIKNGKVRKTRQITKDK